MGSVYDAFNFGDGFENVYSAIPGTAGGADTVTDTLVTPFGNVNLDSLVSGIDAAAPMQPGDAFTGLEAGDSSIGADAFTIGGTTFDPITIGGTEGYDTVYQIVGADPLLELGGGTPTFAAGITLALDEQDFNIYDGTTQIGSIVGNQDVTNLLGLTNTEITVATCHRHVLGSADKRNQSTTYSTSATGSRTSTPRSRVWMALPTPSPTRW